MRGILFLCFVCPLIQDSAALLFKYGIGIVVHGSTTRVSRIRTHLVPLQHELTEQSKWDVHLLSSEDVPFAAELASECFYKPRIVLNFDGMLPGSLEYRFWKGFLTCFNGVDKSDVNRGNYYGFVSRSWSRLNSPSFELSRESFLLGATRKGSNELVGMIEVCLDEPNGLLTPAFANPLRDIYKICGNERPYICNLCVTPTCRRQGVAKLLCQVSEDLVVDHWPEFSKIMFIHVEESNFAAQRMYKKLGYKLVPNTENVVREKDILYYSKLLRVPGSE